MPKGRKILGWLLIAFVVYAIYKQPHQAAIIASSIWHILLNALTSIGAFFSTLMSRK